MNILSVTSKTILIIVLAAVFSASAGEYDFPVKGDIDLSSSFCEFRPLHFHGGIDIRTGGEIGRKIYSPVDGYISRIRYSYSGYGKALYLKDQKGFIYVFGHLSRFVDEVETMNKSLQLKNQSYCFDKHFEKDDLPVSKGQLIAFSGQSGYGAPHIHFEKRTPLNRPLNPLTNGFKLNDTYAPEFRKIGFIYTDSISLFSNGNRRNYEEVKYSRKRNSYYLNEVPFISGPFGIMINAGDRLRHNGPRLNIYQARLFIDDYLYYEVVYEQYDYEQTAMVDLSFDYYNTIKYGSYWHLLYNPAGKDYEGAKSYYSSGGTFDPNSDQSYGLHHARVEIMDEAFNESVLEFDFYYYPTDRIFDIQQISKEKIIVSKRYKNKNIEIEDINVSVTDRKSWEDLSQNRIISRKDGRYEVDLVGLQLKNRMLRFSASGFDGWSHADRYISYYDDKPSGYKLDFELIDGGILFDIKSSRKASPAPLIELQYADGYTKQILSKAVDYNRYAAYYKNETIKTVIESIALIDKGSGLELSRINTGIIKAGNNLDAKELKMPDNFRVKFDNDCFYEPSFLTIKTATKKYPFPRNTVSTVYTVYPKTIPLSKPITVSFDIPDEVDITKAALYRLNKKEEWSWLKSEISGRTIKAKSSLTGTFAVLVDNGAPKIRNVYPKNGKTVFKPLPRISCKIKDGLSKLDKCGDVEIYLDGRWQIPEFDPETKVVYFYPDKNLNNGRHELIIKARDKVGNERVSKTHFFVKEKKS